MNEETFALMSSFKRVRKPNTELVSFFYLSSISKVDTLASKATRWSQCVTGHRGRLLLEENAVIIT